jgi:hypothetical protein
MDMRPHSLFEALAAQCLAVLICCSLCSTQASAFASGAVSLSADADGNTNLSATITIEEAANLIDLLLVTKESGKRKPSRPMNNRDYYFFWIYNATAQKESAIGSISVGNYAVKQAHSRRAGLAGIE